MAAPRRTLGRLALAGALLAAAYGLFEGRRAYIQSCFPRGPGGAPPPALAGDRSAVGRGLAAAPFVRVAPLDGVDRATALRLPNVDALCRRGVEVVADVGFPTVSLPVQSVLWTG